MLTSICSLNGTKVIASQVDKSSGPFSCPKCQGETILKKGYIKIDHFAHKPPTTCEYGSGESNEHRKIKSELYSTLINRGQYSRIELEKDLGPVMPDIYLETASERIGIEVQLSSLTLQTIIDRTEAYHSLKVHVLWLARYSDSLKENRYSPSAWEKWLHALYFGRVYYWLQEDCIMPVHFDSHMLSVESKTWYEEGGEERSVGGYSKYSKRYKTPKIGRMLELFDHFGPYTRKTWQGGNIYIPNAYLYMDTF